MELKLALSKVVRAAGGAPDVVPPQETLRLRLDRAREPGRGSKPILATGYGHGTRLAHVPKCAERADRLARGARLLNPRARAGGGRPGHCIAVEHFL